VFQARLLKTVIKRRGGVKRDQRYAVNAATDNVPTVAMCECEDEQRGETGEAEKTGKALAEESLKVARRLKPQVNANAAIRAA
jgi:hypothetical protein